MLAHFPILYPDEDFRSIVYRYHVLYGNKDFSTSNLELFNRKTYNTSILPRNLNFLLKQLPSNSITLETLLYNHTFYYLLKPFIPAVRVKSVFNEIVYNKGQSNIAILLGRGNAKLITANCRYCPECAANDQEVFGEIYLHRNHQLSFLSICPDHGCKLLSQCPNCFDEFGETPITSLHCVCGFDISTLNVSNHQLDNMRIENELLNNLRQLLEYSTNLLLEDILLKIRNILGSRGYIKFSGSYDRKKIIKDFQTYLVSNNYNQFLEINEHSQMSTNAFILSGSQVKSILFYILFMMFLAGSVEEFCKDNSTFSIPIPFGNGPWICYNSVCPEYNQPIINQCVRVDHQGRYISGLFGCPVCGFSYAKRWRLGDQDEEKPYATLTMGHKWHQLLSDLQSRGLNYSQISKRMNSSPGQIKTALLRTREPRSDKRILQSLKILWDSMNIHDVVADKEMKSYIEHNRKRIIQILEGYPGITRKELAMRHNHLYYKMLKGDSEWMETVLPPSRKNQVQKDWEKLDEEYSIVIARAAEDLYKINPTDQIKKYTILSHVPKRILGQIENTKDKFPKTIDFLNSRVETNEEYLVRHLPVIISQMKKYNKKISSLENIKTFSPMYRKGTRELDDVLNLQLNALIMDQKDE